MAEKTVQDRYHQLVDSVSDLLSRSTTSLTSIELALDDVHLKLKLWGLDVREASGTLHDINEKDPLLAGIIRDVFDSLSEAVHALIIIPEHPPPATQSNLSDKYFSNAFNQLDEIAETITRKDTQESDGYISQFVQQIFKANLSGNKEETLASKYPPDADQYSRSDSQSIRDQTESGGFGFSSPPTLDWHTSVVTIKDGQGLEQVEKVIYDTSSVANLSTPKFALYHKLEERPFPPDEVVTYITPNGPVTPTHYIEVQMKDPRHGINNFVPIRLLIVATLNGFGLLLGRGFMTQYRVILNPSQGSDIYPVIARIPGPATIEERDRIYLRAVELTKRAQAIKAGSTAGPTTTESGTTQVEKYAASSRTSTSSSSKNKE